MFELDEFEPEMNELILFELDVIELVMSEPAGNCSMFSINVNLAL